MSNDRYLIVSYFVVGLLSLGLGAVVYRVLRTPFTAIAESVVGARSPLLKRALAFSMTVAGVLGFLGISYTQQGCLKYSDVVRNRDYLIRVNHDQLQNVGEWIVGTTFFWCVAVLICLMLLRRLRSHDNSS